MTVPVLLLLALTACTGGAPAPTSPEEAHADAHSAWTCPMHPSVRADAPGRCPICGMDLVPVGEEAAGGVAVSTEAAERYGIRTAAVVRRPLHDSIRFAGTVDWDLRKLRDVSVRASGWVTDLRVVAGTRVRAGAPLFALRSPELVAEQSDYLASTGPSRLAAQRRLESMGFSAAQVAALEARGRPVEAVPVLAPTAGVLVSVDVVEGSPLAPFGVAARLADAGAVWVEATLSATLAARLPAGARATVVDEAAPGRTFTGTVHPVVGNEAAARVRVELDDDRGELRAGAVVTVTVEPEGEPALVVPADAVVYAGTRRVVFVAGADGQFVPREVEVGARTGDEVALLSGVIEGERVAAAGAFLLAADSRMQSPAAWSQP